MQTNTPFLLVPWEHDLLTALARQIVHDTHGDPAGACVIIPHSRPRRYFTQTLASLPELPKPFALPRMLTVRELIGLQRETMEDVPFRTIPLLDRVGVLLECLRDDVGNTAAAFPGISEDWTAPQAGPPLPLDDPNRFFPWGLRLASLLEDCYLQAVEPEDMAYTEGHVSPFAAELLARLGRIHRAYTERLDAEGWTTPGYDAFRVARLLGTRNGIAGSAELFPHLAGKQTYIVGFAGLTEVENRIFRHLWQQGAQIVLHSDARLVTEPESAHWACKPHITWLRTWKARTSLLDEASPEGLARPVKRTVDMYEGFDLHSQLDVLERQLARSPLVSAILATTDQHATASTDETGLATELTGQTGQDIQTGPTYLPDMPDMEVMAGQDIAEWPPHMPNSPDAPQPPAASVAVVLPDTGLLMPVLHHLPRKDVNISMGYPLGRSSLFRLLETLMRLQENTVAGNYYWKDVIALLRHPYLRMLSLHGERPLAVPLRHMENSVRTGQRYCDPRTLHPDLAEGEIRALLAETLALCLTRWETVHTPNDLALLLEHLCALLLQFGGTLWDRFPMDAESLYRLMRKVIPALRESSLSEQPFPREVLFTILRESIRQERVPFEADPITGLQVLGMLETRLLRFDELHIVDATEDALPGAPAHDPLLPDPLRAELGLPGISHREQVAAYNFYRLVHGARHVHIYYQSGIERSGLFEDKRARSRFVEELLWQEEQQRNALILPGTPPLHSIQYTMPALDPEDRFIRRTPEISARLDDYLRRPLSPSALDTYLTCPVRFFYERLCGLAPVDEVTEGDDFAAIGDLLHSVLERFYTSRLHRPFTPSDSDVQELLAVFDDELKQSEVADQFPFDSLLMLHAAGRHHLKTFLTEQPSTTVLALEHQLRATVETPNGPRHLTGRIDRMDQRDNGILILDYKTGRVNRPNPQLWDDASLWQRVRNWQGEDDDTLSLLADTLHSVQLPVYLYLHTHSDQAHQQTTTSLPDAGWVELRGGGKEILLLGSANGADEDADAAARRATIIHEHIPLLVAFLFRHMETVPVYRPRRGPHCEWCSCANCCSM